MSVILGPLNLWLRWTEKTYLRRVTSAQAMRRSLEIKSRLFFRAPFGARFRRDTVAGVPVLHVTAGEAADQPLILYFHGGAYVFGSPDTHRAMVATLANKTGVAAVLPKYRKAPEHPFPAAIDDALAVYRAVMDRPGGVILGGDSAGGGLALSLLAEVLRQGLTPPLGSFALSPLTDMTYSGASIVKNAEAEAVLPVERIGDASEWYLNGADPRDPRVSPLFAPFTGAPPVWICVGDTEILLDDSRRMADRLQDQGVDVTLTIEHDHPHVWPLFHTFLPEARRTLDAVADWINSLPRRSGDS
ncbi:alpha/beta hydrolase [Mesobacterium sp. TK19101]|uniref:Alpha/beta hydrolase n=1 Tax=Mesobacterium hydrothermale TaxID=3111907 RepID=A0ABU6HL65_9RHOB|nr:alpha/beta hydrolase [Mesobacterium sp. TK19101]MEC3862611.1 alpha/beta hydrolase [Mesobacterium sp. TK19101]